MKTTTHKINNWVESSCLVVEPAAPESINKYGPLVYIVCDAGSLRMQHSMTPQQTREMAAALLIVADEAEAIMNHAEVAA